MRRGDTPLILFIAAFIIIILTLSHNSAARFRSGAGVSGGAPPPVGSVAWGTLFSYNVGPPGYPTQYIQGDTFANTWADNGNIYAWYCDSYGWNADQSANMGFAQLSTFTTAVTGTTVNNMVANFGTRAQEGADAAAFKSNSMLSVSGTIYAGVWRLIESPGTATGSLQIIKSSDHGATWTPLPPSQAAAYTSPMFPGPYLSWGFVAYGQDYATGGVDNSLNYVYSDWVTTADVNAVGTTQRHFLARVSRSLIGNLSAADWTWYQGGDGMLDANWGAVSTAAVTFLAPAGSGWFGMGYWYLPAFAQYIAFDIDPGPGGSTDRIINLFSANHPWGPWTKKGSIDPAPAHSFYDPILIHKSVGTDGGIHITLALSGNPSNGCNNDCDYTLWYLPITLSP